MTNTDRLPSLYSFCFVCSSYFHLGHSGFALRVPISVAETLPAYVQAATIKIGQTTQEEEKLNVLTQN